MTRFVAGLDIGKVQDYTALAVLEEVEDGDDGGGDPGNTGRQYHIRHLQRFDLGTLYPDISNKVKEVMQDQELKGRTGLVVDAPGVGAPLVDMLKLAGIRPLVAITITGGTTVSGEGLVRNVPKRDLVTTMSILLQTGRLKVSDDLPDALLLLQELMEFKVKIDPLTAHDSYGAWREGQHDDLVLAVALACWWGEQGPRLKVLMG